jgi:capsular exopolysaccharide synthesis family protein
VNPLPDDDLLDTTGARTGPMPRNPLVIAWQRKPLVLLGIVAGTVVAALFAAQRAPVYQSGAQVLVVKKYAEGALPTAGNSPSAGFYEDYVSTHLAIIRSQVVVDMAVKKHNLDQLPSFAGGGNPTGTIMGSLGAARDSKDSGANNIINLSYRGPVADDCQVVIDAVVDSYKDFLDETYRNVSAETLKLITKARGMLQDDLVEKERQYKEFREKAPVVLAQSKDGMPASQLRLGELDSKRLTLLMRQAEIEKQLDALEKAKKEGTGRDLVVSLTSSPKEKADTDETLDLQLLPLILEEQNLLRDWGEDAPQVRAVRTKIAMTREFLSPEKRAARLAARRGTPEADPVDAYARKLRQELESVKLSQQSLVSLTADQQHDLRELARYEMKDSALQADITKTRLVLDQTIKHLTDLNLIRDFGGYDARMISFPGPGGRVGTGMMQVILAGVAAGLLAGMGLAYLADMSDKSFRSPDEIRRRLGLPVVAHVPLMEAEGTPSSPDAPQVDRSLAIVHRPMSGEAEAARSLRTCLYFNTKGTNRKVIQVTSANTGDGKTTVAGNLAVAIAQSGKRVVLVDGDMRRPRIHALFGVRPELGLSSVIAGEASVTQALVDSGVDRLSLLTCGPRPENPAELLTQPRFEAVLDELRQQFDYVIVDTPPLLAVTDPAVVVSRMDGCFLVVRLSRHGRPAAERAREILHTLQANVIGVVVNAVGKASGAYGYEHYSYEHYYGGPYVSAAGQPNGHAGTAARPRGRGKRGRSKRLGWFRRLLS